MIDAELSCVVVDVVIECFYQVHFHRAFIDFDCNLMFINSFVDIIAQPSVRGCW